MDLAFDEAIARSIHEFAGLPAARAAAAEAPAPEPLAGVPWHSLEGEDGNLDLAKLEARRQAAGGVLVLDGVAGQAEFEALCSKVRERGPESLRAAGVGSNKAVGDGVRGDRIAWISAAWDSGKSMFQPLFEPLRQFHSRLRGFGGLAHLALSDRVSVQLACYPGEGEAGYRRHADVRSDATGERRVLTAIVYLNPDWCPEHGGELLLYGAGVGGGGGVVKSVEPRGNRLVLFPSEMEHEVAAARHAERWAVTVWFYGEPAPPPPPPPPPLSQKPPRIFVAIPSYRDPQCQHTIADLFAKAAKPDRIAVGVCWQLDLAAGDAQVCLEELVGGSSNSSGFGRFDQVRSVMVPATRAAGPCVARSMCQALWQGEEYLLNIDSHMRFRERWDEELIAMLAMAQAACGHDRAILTTYPSGFELAKGNETGQAAAVELPAAVTSLVAGPPALAAERFGEDGMLRLCARRLDTLPITPQPNPFWAAGYNFALAEPVLASHPYPRLEHLFFGEEMLMAARLWSHGFDFFTPHKEVVYHLWSRAYRPVLSSPEPARAAATQAVTAFLTAGLPPVPGFTVGPRGLPAYEQAAGVRFGEQKVVEPGQ